MYIFYLDSVMQVLPDFTDERTLEKYSSAFTLSDMEIFVFPELFFPLVLANIMSPVVWKWREDPWFADITKKSFTYKVNRIKQFIMDHYIFNLDLETWGLTTKEVEMKRFQDFIDMETLKQSNALFGYEGDKYYFDMDIRKHFGLDKFTSDKIPYWKTETIEAMTAFRHKPGFTTGAGECVSLSALYAAALFVVGRIPLENIFLIATPLHSQNFVDIDDGLITNNRRIVTKNMWFNGTHLTEKARRALEKERVTIVSHISGYIHRIYETATIDPEAYMRFSDKLRRYLKTELSFSVLINFLRSNALFQSYFQYRYNREGSECYISMEKLFEGEHLLHKSFSDQNYKAFLAEIPVEFFSSVPLSGKIVLQDAELIFSGKLGGSALEVSERLIGLFRDANCFDIEGFEKCLEDLAAFIHVEPRLPAFDKQFETSAGLNIHVNHTREEIIGHIRENSERNETARLALYTYRPMDILDWEPFIKAALERNPVSLEGLNGKSVSEAYQLIYNLPDESIYDANRLALPDEVWNFGRGDGIEKAVLFANFLAHIDQNASLSLAIDQSKVILYYNRKKYYFHSAKSIRKEVQLAYSPKECFCRCC